MLEISRKTNTILFKLSSEISILPNVIEEVEKFLIPKNVDDLTNVLLVTEELLTNAVEHGNQNDPARLTVCDIEQIDDDLFKIVVKDEGDGFDYRCIDFKLPENPKYVQKRGYILINALSKRIVFEGNGSCVTAYVGKKNNKDHQVQKNYQSR